MRFACHQTHSAIPFVRDRGCAWTRLSIYHSASSDAIVCIQGEYAMWAFMYFEVPKSQNECSQSKWFVHIAGRRSKSNLWKRYKDSECWEIYNIAGRSHDWQSYSNVRYRSLNKHTQNSRSFVFSSRYRQSLRDPNVTFSGYRHPHPLNYDIVVRIQTNDASSPVEALANCLDDLSTVFDELVKKFRRLTGNSKDAGNAFSWLYSVCFCSCYLCNSADNKWGEWRTKDQSDRFRRRECRKSAGNKLIRDTSGYNPYLHHRTFLHMVTLIVFTCFSCVQHGARAKCLAVLLDVDDTC